MILSDKDPITDPNLTDIAYLSDSGGTADGKISLQNLFKKFLIALVSTNVVRLGNFSQDADDRFNYFKIDTNTEKRLKLSIGTDVNGVFLDVSEDTGGNVSNQSFTADNFYFGHWSGDEFLRLRNARMQMGCALREKLRAITDSDGNADLGYRDGTIDYRRTDAMAVGFYDPATADVGGVRVCVVNNSSASVDLGGAGGASNYFRKQGATVSTVALAAGECAVLISVNSKWQVISIY